MAQKVQKSSAETKSFPKLIIASTEESADLLYATGFNAPDPVLYFEAGGEKTLVVSPLEYARASAEVKPGVRVIEYTPFLESNRQDKLLAVNVSRKFGIDRWLVPKTFPFGEAEKLRAAGIEVQCCPEGPLYPARQVKSAAEQKAVLASQQAAE